MKLLGQPGFGNRQIEQNLMILLRGSKGFIEGMLGFVPLLIDEFPAHLVFGGQVADRLTLGERLDGDNFSDIWG